MTEMRVELLRNVKGLGKTGDVVVTSKGRMRNVLFPTKRAVYVQRYHGPRDRLKEAYEAWKASLVAEEAITSTKQTASSTVV